MGCVRGASPPPLPNFHTSRNLRPATGSEFRVGVARVNQHGDVALAVDMAAALLLTPGGTARVLTVTPAG